MSGKGVRKTHVLSWIIIGVLALALCLTGALADDAALQADLPGQWILSDQIQGPDESVQTVDLACLALKENGKCSLIGTDQDGVYAFACEGSWAFELVPNAMDRLTLLFTATDNPVYADSAYTVECVFDAYSESWVESDTLHTYLLLEPVRCSGISPFEDLAGLDNVALHREQGPNMRVVNCKDYVSLREKPSASSARLAKVPLGAAVLADPYGTERDGFVPCYYQDTYGYILAEYLQPAETAVQGR